jgi:hypothetical protein
MGEVSFLDVSKRFTLRVDGEVNHVQTGARSMAAGTIVAWCSSTRNYCPGFRPCRT